MPVVSVKPVNIINEINDSLFIQIDPEAMEMVFINIISEAVSAGGTVTVACSQGERCAEVAISDNGVGTGEEFMRKDLFKPFKTTRKNGLGIAFSSASR